MTFTKEQLQECLEQELAIRKNLELELTKLQQQVKDKQNLVCNCGNRIASLGALIRDIDE